MTDRKLKQIAREFRVGILNGRPSTHMCFAVCAALQGFLSALGVETELVQTHFVEVNHYWLKLPNGRILDPTADQFGLEPVYLGPLPVAYVTRQARYNETIERLKAAL